MSHGRKITLHLVEGEASGIIKGQIGNWVGLVTQAPRTKLKDLTNDTDIERPGVYVLTGPDPDDITGSAVYIGESENVFARLRQHEKDDDKDFFEEIAVITSADENLTKGHIRYLESRLIQIAYQTKRSTVLNGTSPDLPPLPPADRDEMEVFLEHLQMLLPVLGMNFALPRPVRPVANQQDQTSYQVQIESPTFALNTRERETNTEVTAQAQQIGSEFVILEGSEALLRHNSKTYTELKERLIRNGSLIKTEDRYKFAEDVPFSSPSAAAAVIRGQNTNGRSYWKLANGQTYGEWLDARIEAEEQHAIEDKSDYTLSKDQGI